VITEVIKLLPLITVVCGGIASKDKIMAQLQKVTHITQVIAVQSEINDLAKLIYLDIVTDGIASADPLRFAEYCRKNLQVKQGSERDTSKDFWGTEYRLLVNGKRFSILSAGPDTAFGTEDDIVAGLSLE
jgi:hypothetical protein